MECSHVITIDLAVIQNEITRSCANHSDEGNQNSEEDLSIVQKELKTSNTYTQKKKAWTHSQFQRSHDNCRRYSSDWMNSVEFRSALYTQAERLPLESCSTFPFVSPIFS